MVLLTTTPAIVEAAERHNAVCTTEPPLELMPGQPISHADLINLSRKLSKDDSGASRFALDNLLKGSQVYVPPKKPSAPKVSTTDVYRHYYCQTYL